MDNHSLQASDGQRQVQSRPSPAFTLTPAEPRMAMAELGACLTLVAPSGMSADDRGEWLKVAHMTLHDVPSDLLTRGCEHARKTCRFASEIVPSILAEIERPWGWRKNAKAESVPRIPPPLAPEPEYVDPAEIAKLLSSLAKGPQ